MTDIAMPGGGAERWTFRAPTPLGIAQSSYEFADDGLHFTSDDPLRGNEVLPWASIRQGCTAAMPGMGGRGGPDLANWIPSQMEWLLLSRTEGGGEAFMRMLPQGGDRDAVVAAVQARLGAAWAGTRLPLKEAQSKLGISAGASDTVKVVGLVVAVIACLIALLFLIGVLAHPLVFTPIGCLVGGWVCREGLAGLRDAISVANTPTAKTRSAAIGLVELEGRAITDLPSPAGITGRPSVWWDVSVYLWHVDSDKNGSWQQVAARYGGNSNHVQLEDDSGRLPIWLEDATVLVSGRSWESEKDELPAPGLALLDAMGFPWTGKKRMRVVEQCLEANGSLYVLGTLDERRHVCAFGQLRGLDRWRYLLRSGEWRRALVAAVPAPARMVLSVLVAYIDMVTSIGRGGERASQGAAQGEPPPMDPAALLVWKGRGGRPFVVSNLPETAALAGLRHRSMWTFAFGGAILCFTLYQLIEYFGGT
jgi:hypothetical protein